MPAAANLNEHKSAVLKRYAGAMCKVDKEDPGPGRSWAIYERTSAKLHKITGGWMTPAQAWERAAAKIKRAASTRAPAPHQTIADLEDMLRNLPRDLKLMTNDGGAEKPVRNIKLISYEGRLLLQLSTESTA